MAKAKFRHLITSTTGLNNVFDPVRLEFDFKTGVTELSQAVNVDIDSAGRPTRRKGRNLRVTVSGRCGFAHGETCLFVSGTTLYQMKADYSTTVIRADLTEGARMKYYPIAGRIYYVNGQEKGYVFKGADNAWEKGTYTQPADNPRVLSDPPRGHLVSWFAGRALIARDNAMFASEASFYGVFDLHRNFKLTPDKITMLRPTPQGLWVGTTTQILFYRGTKWSELRREPVAEYGVIEGSDITCAGEIVSAPGRPVVFTTPEGICVGGDDGTFVNITHNKITFPSGRYASAAVVDDRYLVLIEP